MLIDIIYKICDLLEQKIYYEDANFLLIGP